MNRIYTLIILLGMSFNSFAWSWPQCRNYNGGSPEQPSTVYLGDQATFGHDSWAQVDGKWPKWRVAIHTSSDVNNGLFSAWSGYCGDCQHKTATAPSFTSTGTWYWGMQVEYTDAGLTTAWYCRNETTWQNMWGSPTSNLTITVNALSNPTSAAATQVSASQIDLSWALWNSKNVMIVRKKSTESWTEPSQGTAYSAGNTIGSGVVVYNGSGTSYNNTGLTSSTGYDYKFYSVNNNYYSAGDVKNATTASEAGDYFRSKADGNWNSTGTWESSDDNSAWVNATLTPSSTAGSVLINHVVAVNTDETVGALTINASKSLTVNSGKSLTVTGTLTNSAGASGLVVESGGSLKQGSSGVAATVKRNISNDLGYHFLSSPVYGQNFKTGFIPSVVGTDFEFYYFNEAATDNLPWINARTAGNASLAAWTDGQFVIGRGYLCAYNNTWGVAHTFTGNLNAGQIDLSITNTSTGGKGWNLVGNPFACSIDWAQVTKPSGVNAYYYIYNPSSQTYLYHNGTTGSSGVTQYIAPEQAFFTFTSEATNTLSLTTASQVHSTQSFVKSANEVLSEIALELIQGTHKDEVKIGLNLNASNDFDVNDAFKLYSMNPSYANFFSLTSNGTKVAYNSIPEVANSPIQLGVQIAETGNYALQLSQVTGNFENVTLILEDLLTGKSQNLNENPVYTFTGEANGNVNRFLLKFGGVGIDNPSTTQSKIFAYGNKLNIQNPGKALLEVFAITGQKLVSSQINTTGLYQTTLNQPSGYYIVRLTSHDGTQVSKIFIQ